MESFATVVEMAEKCRNDAYLASPYVSSTPLMAVLDRIDSDVPIVFVSSFNPEDFLSGSFERSALVALWTDKRVIVLRCPRLHAKYFRLDNDVFVGSANLTNSGMGLASNSNIEILIKPRNTFNSRVFEDLLEIRSTRLSESEYNYLIGITPQPKGQGGGLSGFLNEDEVPDLWFPRSPEASWLWESAALPMEEFSVDQHADIWAWGVSAYELLTMRKPFPGDTPDEVLRLQVNRGEFLRPRQINPDIPQELEKTILRCLSVDIAQRHHLMGVVVHELQQALYV